MTTESERAAVACRTSGRSSTGQRLTALGPLLGGWLTTTFSWRWAFGINIPLGPIVIIVLFALWSTAGGLDTARSGGT